MKEAAQMGGFFHGAVVVARQGTTIFRISWRA